MVPFDSFGVFVNVGIEKARETVMVFWKREANASLTSVGSHRLPASCRFSPTKEKGFIG
jgi:hypothetical protein